MSSVKCHLQSLSLNTLCCVVPYTFNHSGNAFISLSVSTLLICVCWLIHINIALRLSIDVWVGVCVCLCVHSLCLDLRVILYSFFFLSSFSLSYSILFLLHIQLHQYYQSIFQLPTSFMRLYSSQSCFRDSHNNTWRLLFEILYSFNI